jgi:histone arginine demethylase JMJD6
MASKHKGTARQLWSDDSSPNTDTPLTPAPDYPLRLAGTRRKGNLCEILERLAYMERFGGDSNTDGEIACFTEDVVRITAEGTSKETFDRDYKRQRTPALISGCTDRWPCPCADTDPANYQYWSPDNLLAALHGSTRVEVAMQDATVSLQDFVDYMRSDGARTDDSPVYVFETLVKKEHKTLLDMFRIPEFFTTLSEKDAVGCHKPGDLDDLLSGVSCDGQRFGTHRWMLMGSKNTGSYIHVDPLATSAWNTLLWGHKLWVLFDPETKEEVLMGSGDYSMASEWFAFKLPEILALCASDEWPVQLKKPIIFVQKAGETVFVPAGWWHAVLNLDETVCVTQNFASVCDFQQVQACLFEEGGEEADELRARVFADTESGGFGVEREGVENRCVHCWAENAPFFSLYPNRAVCKKCLKARAEYALIDADEIKKIHGIEMYMLPEDEIPPHTMKENKNYMYTEHYLVEHIVMLCEGEA